MKGRKPTAAAHRGALTDLRTYARGQECQIRIPFVCNRDPATTVLAHIRLAGVTGTALKAADLLGAWACSACHDVADSRAKTDFSPDVVRLYHLEGMARTIAELVRREVLP